MHIPDGILPLPVTVAGYALSFALAALCLRQIRRAPDPRAAVPPAALLTAAFFVASSLYIPIPPISVHLVLNGLLGVLLGWFAFPAILIGLFLQAVTLGHGGITTLGVNALLLGVPALLAHALFRQYRRVAPARQRWAMQVLGFLAGSGALVAAVAGFSILLLGTLPATLDPELERRALGTLLLAYLPLAVLEGVLTVLVLRFLLRVSPALVLGNPVKQEDAIQREMPAQCPEIAGSRIKVHRPESAGTRIKVHRPESAGTRIKVYRPESATQGMPAQRPWSARYGLDWTQWEPRTRLLALVLLAFAISSVTRLELLPLVMLPALLAAWSSRTGFMIWWRRLRYPSLLVLAMVALLPWLTGSTPLWPGSGLAMTVEGSTLAVLILVRFYAILILAMVLLGSAPLLTHLHALQRLGVPDLFVDMTLLVVRHLQLLNSDLQQMHRAMRVRGRDPQRFSWRALQSHAWLLGGLLVRSHERSARVYAAMRLRGYGCPRPDHTAHRGPTAATRQWLWHDRWPLAAVVLFCTLLIGMGPP